jgi:hypothetical protein
VKKEKVVKKGYSFLHSKKGDIAQLVERCPCKADVSGSSPLISTNQLKIF